MIRATRCIVACFSFFLAQSVAAFEFQEGQRYCVSDLSLQCEAVWEVENIDADKAEVTIVEHVLATVPKDTDLPIEKWQASRDNFEISTKLRSVYRIQGVMSDGGLSAGELHLCEATVLSFSGQLDGMQLPELERRLTEGAMELRSEQEICFEIYTCSKKVGFVRHQYIFRRNIIDGADVPEAASYMRLLGKREDTEDVLAGYPAMVGNLHRQPANCY